jgi:hypothetical protein
MSDAQDEFMASTWDPLPASPASPASSSASSASLVDFHPLRDVLVLPPGYEVEYLPPPMFDMLVTDESCIDCDAGLPRGSIVYRRPIGPWYPIRSGREAALSRPRAWYYYTGPMPGCSEAVCSACAAAELLPKHDEQERQRIIENARAQFELPHVRVVVDGITWRVGVQPDATEWLMASVVQKEVLPGCHLFGLARCSPETGAVLDVEGLPLKVRRELEWEIERELWHVFNHGRPQLNAQMTRSRYFWHHAMQEPDPTARQALYEEARPPWWVRVLLWIGELPGGDGDPGQ